MPEGKEGAGKPYHLKGKPFYRIIDGFIDQAGAETESVFGGQFKDDPGGLKLKHDRKVGRHQVQEGVMPLCRRGSTSKQLTAA